MKLMKSPDKNKNRNSNIDNKSQKSFESDRDEVRDNKTPKKGIVIIGDSMIKYMNVREISRSRSVKVKRHPGETTEKLIDYGILTVRKNKNDGYSPWYQCHFK